MIVSIHNVTFGDYLDNVCVAASLQKMGVKCAIVEFDYLTGQWVYILV